MVGLPVRGKTLLARDILRYARWIGIESKCFSVAAYRAHHHIPHKSEQEDDKNDSINDSSEYSKSKDDLLKRTASPPIPLIESNESKDKNSNFKGLLQSDYFDFADRASASQRSKFGEQALHDLLAFIGTNSQEGKYKMAVLDASNVQQGKRAHITKTIKKFCRENGKKVQTLFLEVIKDVNEEQEKLMVLDYIAQLKELFPKVFVQSDTFELQHEYLKRIAHYRKVYTSIDVGLENLSYIKYINDGKDLKMNHVHGYIPSKFLFYMLNASHSPNRITFVLKKQLLHGKKFQSVSIWTFPTANLSKDAGIICLKAALSEPKKHETQQDIHNRLEDLLMELEGQSENITIYADVRILNAIYRYYQPKQDLLTITNTNDSLMALQVEPKAYGVCERRYMIKNDELIVEPEQFFFYDA